MGMLNSEEATVDPEEDPTSPDQGQEPPEPGQVVTGGSQK